MSIGPLSGLPASAAGVPLAQTKGSETDRVQQETTAQQRQSRALQKAEAAAGIGETDGEEHQTADRDADGRRPWQIPVRAAAADGESPPAPTPLPDPSGISGSLLDLSG